MMSDDSVKLPEVPFPLLPLRSGVIFPGTTVTIPVGRKRSVALVKEIESGTRMEIGCHHAEMNVVCNAAANGVSTRGAWLICNGEPCMMCAKMIHHAGILRVLVETHLIRLPSEFNRLAEALLQGPQGSLRSPAP